MMRLHWKTRAAPAAFRSVASRSVALRSVALLLLAPLVALALLAGCGVDSDSGAGSGGDDERPRVLTTFTVIADLVREVGGDRVEVASITKPGAEIHGYEPTPSDLRNAAGADLILWNGLDLERWFEQFIDTAGAENAILTEGIEPIPIAGTSEYAGKPNPHAWMSPENAAVYLDNIAAALTELDPDGAAEYERNAVDFKREVTVVGERARTALDGLEPHRRLLVTCEGAFSYLARDLGLREAYIWPVNAEQEGTPGQIAATVEAARESEVPAVFCESTVSDEAMQQVASEAGTELAGTLYVDSLSEADGPVPTYLELLRHDIDTIADALAADAGAADAGAADAGDADGR